MTDDLRSERLTGEEVAWLAGAGGELSPGSPLVPFAGLADAAAAPGPADRGLGGEPWDRVVAVLRRPSTWIRVTVPGATESLVQYFLGGEPFAEGLIGCWLEGDGLRVSFPWSERDVVSLTSQVLFSTPPESVELDSLVLGADALAALAAAIDAIRSQDLAAMAARTPAAEARLDREALEQQRVAGSQSTDARWLVAMLGLTGFTAPASSDAVTRGIDELVAAGMLVGEEDGWRPGPVLRTLAAWWGNQLPAVSYETTRFDGDRVVRHDHRIVMRGDGPLCVLHRTGGSGAGMPTSLRVLSPLGFFDEVTRALHRVTSDEPDFVHVLEPVPVRDLETASAVAGYLQPGRWYVTEVEAGAWARVEDPEGPLEGWAPIEALSRRVEVPDEVAAVSEPDRASPLVDTTGSASSLGTATAPEAVTAPAVPVPPAEQTAETEPGESARPSNTRRQVLGGVVAGVALLALVGVLLLSVFGDDEGVSYRGAAWYPDGSRLTFVGDGDLFMIDPDGTDRTRIELVGDVDDMAWSPTGARFAYSGWDGIRIGNVDGSDEVLVAELASAVAPAWSPDGDRLAFSSSAEGDADIWLVDADGSDLTQFTDDDVTDPRNDWDPAWSPDGTRLAYAREDSESYTAAIWVVSLDGEESSRLAEGRNPAWSPDGGRIAYGCGDGICVMDADGSNPTELTGTGGEYHRDPAWSPDGSLIAFESTKDGSDIYVVGPDGSGLVRVAG